MVANRLDNAGWLRRSSDDEKIQHGVDERMVHLVVDSGATVTEHLQNLTRSEQEEFAELRRLGGWVIRPSSELEAPPREQQEARQSTPDFAYQARTTRREFVFPDIQTAREFVDLGERLCGENPDSKTRQVWFKFFYDKFLYERDPERQRELLTQTMDEMRELAARIAPLDPARSAVAYMSRHYPDEYRAIVHVYGRDPHARALELVRDLAHDELQRRDPAKAQQLREQGKHVNVEKSRALQAMREIDPEKWGAVKGRTDRERAARAIDFLYHNHPEAHARIHEPDGNSVGREALERLKELNPAAYDRCHRLTPEAVEREIESETERTTFFDPERLRANAASVRDGFVSTRSGPMQEAFERLLGENDPSKRALVVVREQALARLRESDREAHDRVVEAHGENAPTRALKIMAKREPEAFGSVNGKTEQERERQALELLRSSQPEAYRVITDEALSLTVRPEIEELARSSYEVIPDATSIEISLADDSSRARDAESQLGEINRDDLDGLAFEEPGRDDFDPYDLELAYAEMLEGDPGYSVHDSQRMSAEYHVMGQIQTIPPAPEDLLNRLSPLAQERFANFEEAISDRIWAGDSIAFIRADFNRFMNDLRAAELNREMRDSIRADREQQRDRPTPERPDRAADAAAAPAPAFREKEGRTAPDRAQAEEGRSIQLSLSRIDSQLSNKSLPDPYRQSLEKARAELTARAEAISRGDRPAVEQSQDSPASRADALRATLASRGESADAARLREELRSIRADSLAATRDRLAAESVPRQERIAALNAQLARLGAEQSRLDEQPMKAAERESRQLATEAARARLDHECRALTEQQAKADERMRTLAAQEASLRAPERQQPQAQPQRDEQQRDGRGRDADWRQHEDYHTLSQQVALQDMLITRVETMRDETRQRADVFNARAANAAATLEARDGKTDQALATFERAAAAADRAKDDRLSAQVRVTALREAGAHMGEVQRSEIFHEAREHAERSRDSRLTASLAGLDPANKENYKQRDESKTVEPREREAQAREKLAIERSLAYSQQEAVALEKKHETLSRQVTYLNREKEGMNDRLFAAQAPPDGARAVQALYYIEDGRGGRAAVVNERVLDFYLDKQVQLTAARTEQVKGLSEPNRHHFNERAPSDFAVYSTRAKAHVHEPTREHVQLQRHFNARLVDLTERQRPELGRMSRDYRFRDLAYVMRDGHDERGRSAQEVLNRLDTDSRKARGNPDARFRPMSRSDLRLLDQIRREGPDRKLEDDFKSIRDPEERARARAEERHRQAAERQKEQQRVEATTRALVQDLNHRAANFGHRGIDVFYALTSNPRMQSTGRESELYAPFKSLPRDTQKELHRMAHEKRREVDTRDRLAEVASIYETSPALKSYSAVVKALQEREGMSKQDALREGWARLEKRLDEIGTYGRDEAKDVRASIAATKESHTRLQQLQTVREATLAKAEREATARASHAQPFRNANERVQAAEYFRLGPEHEKAGSKEINFKEVKLRDLKRGLGGDKDTHYKIARGDDGRDKLVRVTSDEVRAAAERDRARDQKPRTLTSAEVMRLASRETREQLRNIDHEVASRKLDLARSFISIDRAARLIDRGRDLERQQPDRGTQTLERGVVVRHELGRTPGTQRVPTLADARLREHPAGAPPDRSIVRPADGGRSFGGPDRRNDSSRPRQDRPGRGVGGGGRGGR